MADTRKTLIYSSIHPHANGIPHQQVRVPSSCLPTTAAQTNSGDGAGEQSLGPGYVFDRQDDNEIPQTSRCFYENKLYDDGTQWTAEHDRCMMCSCQRGRVVCDPIVCPALTCGTASVIHPPGDCCPMCQSELHPPNQVPCQRC